MIKTISETDSKDKIIEKLSDSWHESGIEKGDTVLIHSSLSSFLKEYKAKNIFITPDDILDSFILSVGTEGTLLFPTYNFGFTKGMLFDINNTKSETGILTEAARLRKDSVRTGHPLFSFAVLGYHKEIFRKINNYSAFGSDSPFAKLLELKGKIAALDVAGENCMTFYHYAEETVNAPNRLHKKFTGPYKDSNGTESIREYNLFVRNLEMFVETDVKPMEEYLWSKGFYQGCRPGEGNCLHVIQSEIIFEEASKVIREGRSLNMLYKTGKVF